jgi:GNAT superfamily N-acetyltransferase
VASSTIEIHRADLEKHRPALIELLRRYLTERSDEKRYDWFYRDNPRGKASVWIATETRSGEIVGSAAIVPQRVRLGEGEYDACVMADFWVHPNHRVLGPALRLQRACIEGARNAGMLLFIDLPQGSMPAVYKRLGVTAATHLVRYARPLRADAYVAKLRLPRWLSRGLGGAANLLLSSVEPRVPSRYGFAVVEERGPFGPDFGALADRVRGSYPVCIVRSADYLNWRYHRHYFLEHHIVTARRDGRLEGYAVFAIRSGTAQLVDLFGVSDPPLARALIAAAIRLARARGATVLNVPLLAHSPLTEVATSMWFRARETMPVIVHALSPEMHGRLDHLYLTYGDLDY